MRWRENPNGERQWLSADGYWYPTEDEALLAGLDKARNGDGVAVGTPPLPTPAQPDPVPPAIRPTGKGGRVSIPRAAYLGGHSEQKAKFAGNLIIRDGVLGMGLVGKPRIAKVNLTPGASMRVDSAVIAKSRVGKAVAFGVLAAAAKSQESVGYLMIDLANGGVITYQVEGMTGPSLAATLRGPLATYGIRI